jgi:F-type H+-transporting ATPase subunit gamma
MLVGSGKDQVHLLVVVTADRGLAGAFNTNVGRAARNLAQRLMAEGKTVKIVTVGRKGRDYLRRELGSNIIAEISYAGKKRIEYSDVRQIGEDVVSRLGRDEFDVATVIFNRFVSVINQVPTEIQLIPPVLAGAPDSEPTGVQAIYEFEPDEETILARLLPKNLEVQLYRTLLESGAGEQGARMSAMDNATRNAGEAIKKLTLNYNRTRQANITRELIEIISGAEAL